MNGKSKIALKCMIKHNRPNWILLSVICIIVAVITLLYGSTDSIGNQVSEQKKIVFGTFTDIYYLNSRQTVDAVTDEEFQNLLPGFHYDRYGVIYTVYKENLTDTKYLNMGYLDSTALELSCLYILDGRLPQSDNEIALSQGMLSYCEKSLGESIDIGDYEYAITGVFSDYGHLWPQGDTELNENISPVNAIITKDQAAIVHDDTQRIFLQILIKRTDDVSNAIEEARGFYQNTNAYNKEEDTLKIPKSFTILIYIIIIFMILSFLILNRENMRLRIKTYYSLGMEMYQAISSIKYELYFISILGFIGGIVIGLLLTALLLAILSASLNSKFTFCFDVGENYYIYIAILISVLIIINLSCDCLRIKVTDLGTANRHLYPLKEKRISLISFDSYVGRRFLVITTLVIAFTITMLTYSVYYGFYFQRDVLALASGYVPRDYDFQFISNLQSEAPLGSIDDGEEHIPVLFTDLYEKNGASQEFIDQLAVENGIDHVISYRENTKMNVLLHAGETDAYLEGYDDSFILQEWTDIVDYNVVYDIFDYNDDDVLINSSVTGYTEQSLSALQDSIVEGSIDLDKISSGEEVILRVPAYKQVTEMFDDMETHTVYIVSPDNEDAINAALIKVGDVITLTGILTDEFINGGVEEKDLSSFYRYDVEVKVGAIIRTEEGKLPSLANSGLNVYQILTTNEGFDKLGIPGKYSVVSVYTDDDADQSSMRELMYEYSVGVPDMKLEDWQSEVMSYKIYNFFIKLFSIALIAILIIVGFTFILSQLVMKMRIAMPTYFLYKVNGLSRHALNKMWTVQIGMCYVIGSITAIPLIILTFTYALNITSADLFNCICNWYMSIGYALTGLIVFMVSFICRNLYKKADENCRTVNHSD